ncbi:MAG: GH36-type glycosyl hydrolase domain-containing protein [Bacteroidales bacterium]
MYIQNSHGLKINFLDNGSIRDIEADPIRISMRETTPFSAYGANLYVRKKSDTLHFTALTGPESNSIFSISNNTYSATGIWEGIEYECNLRLSDKSMSWQFAVSFKNLNEKALEIDVFYVQDAGLKPLNSGLVNELYVSQYLERRILYDKQYGPAVCCRQNMKESVGNPWIMIASKNGSTAASTDGMQFYGKSYRKTRIPEGLLKEKAGGEYADESSVLVLQEKSFMLSPSEIKNRSFVATYMHDHPTATSEKDLIRLPELMSEFGNAFPSVTNKKGLKPARNLFNTSQFLPVHDLDDEEIDEFFGMERRHSDVDNNKLLSFFSATGSHVVTGRKEILADRQHGHIIQANNRLVPDESIMSTNPFAFGVFNSHIAQGNTNFNVLLSINTSPFNLTSESGQRIFVKIDDQWFLLGVPSAFEMGLSHCRWIYKTSGHIFQIRTWTSKSSPQINTDFRVLSGDNVDILITHDFDPINGWSISEGSSPTEFIVKPASDSMIAARFSKARFRILIQSKKALFTAGSDSLLYQNDESSANSLFVLDIKNTNSFCMSFIGEIGSAASPVIIDNVNHQFTADFKDSQSFWRELSNGLQISGNQKDISAFREILPWYGMNALIHYLTPYGLEQFGGAAWGTRDVSQGPVDLLLHLGKYEEARQVLKIIFSNQNKEGGWPQWWMFDSYSHIRAGDAHGDVVYWCIIALSSYIKITGDAQFLDEVLPYFHGSDQDQPEESSLGEHLDRLIKMITDSFIPGTSLVPFGGGDWNDSLQPVSKDLAERMISSWTVQMNYQAFDQLTQVYELAGYHDKARQLKYICGKIKSDFNQYLVKDGIVAGYGLTETDGSISVLLHPSDKTTGIKYSVLPMNRGIISGIFTPEQAVKHQEIIEKHLKGHDGVRLMDRPLKYRGGIQKIFQRAESSTYFGREIGLMYIHEHIRYAESLAITGNPEAFVKALRQSIPVSYREVVPCGDIRQANCYYSSSDVVFKNRYEADLRYDEIKTGNITLKGGWRIYSSGPGIFTGLIVTRLLGIRTEHDKIIFDPVMPVSFNGLTANISFMGFPLQFVYKISGKGFEPQTLRINKKEIKFNNEKNLYRAGGAIIDKRLLMNVLKPQKNIIEIEL